MAKSFRLRFSRVLPGFTARRSDESTAADPSLANPKTLDIDFPLPLSSSASPSSSTSHPLLLRRPLGSPPVISLGCGCRPIPPRRRRRRHRRQPLVALDLDADPSRARETPAYLWRQDSNFHVVTSAKGDGRDDLFPLRRKIDSSDDSGWFSSDDEDEDDHEDYYYCNEKNKSYSSESEHDGQKSTEWKVKESFAVVKRSEDPKGDFRLSMAEMIVEKKMCEPGDLEQLLRCFLSLNSRHHHRDIVAAFSEIWEALFPADVGAAKG